MKKHNILDIENMFSYIKRNRKALNAILKEMEKRSGLSKLYNEIKEAEIDKVLANGEYFIEESNSDIWEDDDKRVYSHENDFMLSDSDFNEVYLKAFNAMKASSAFLEIAPSHLEDEDAHIVDYGYNHRSEILKLENELIERFEPILGFSKKDLVCHKNHVEYINYLKSAINK